MITVGDFNVLHAGTFEHESFQQSIALRGTAPAHYIATEPADFFSRVTLQCFDTVGWVI